jgi:3-deoxy-D-manno-octulosonate 8-phosphate phosphatase KdsC-like HAD superfamily phosphatase
MVEKLNRLPSSLKKLEDGGWPPIDLFEGCGGGKKLEVLKDWLSESNGTLEECGAMGDDLVDVPMLKAAVFRAAPISGEKAVKDICHFVSERNGGEGAVRDLVNYILQVQGKNPFDLPFE